MRKREPVKIVVRAFYTEDGPSMIDCFGKAYAAYFDYVLKKEKQRTDVHIADEIESDCGYNNLNKEN
jgi:hypothetical protein